MLVGEAPAPTVGLEDVLVRVCASSVNPVDCAVRRGGLRRYASVPFPIIPGVDVSGVVEQVGPKAQDLRTGDEVFGFIPRVGGACAEMVACNFEWLQPKPIVLSHAEAAVLPCVGLTALQGLRDKAGLRAGQTVLIVGASGGVGSMAVQIARAMELEVVAVCSTPNVQFMEKLGATRVIDYLKNDVLAEKQRFDAIFDSVGNRSFWSYRKLLRGSGRHVGISCTREAMLASALSHLLPGRKSVQFHVKPRRRDLGQLRRWIDEGKVRPIVSLVYNMADVAEAHRQCETRRTVGKIAITIP
jgi:NADPH:quinone reductase-like Zn-dependent oxidoreductase